MQPSGQLSNLRFIRRPRPFMRALLLLLALVSALSTWTPTQAANEGCRVPAKWLRNADCSNSYVLRSAYSHSAIHTQFVVRSTYSVQSVVRNPQSAIIPASPAVSAGRQRYFAQTAHFLRGAFLDYWETHGAIPVLGLPITEPIVENGLAVQYLERTRLEYHPEIPGKPQNKVLLTRLGVTLAERRNLIFTPLPEGSDTPTSHFFTETGHNLANAFLTYWQRNGGLAVFGYPISEEFVETNEADGQPYTVQYFERNRFEWHPELQPPYNIQLGLLGVEYARNTNLDPLARIMLPSPLPSAEADLSDDPRLVDLVEADLLPAIQELGRTPEFRWVPAVLIQNKVDVEFTAIDDQDIGGAFIATGSKRRPYLIVIPERYRGASQEAIASVLAHEATHAYDFTTGVQPKTLGCSIEEELRAYKNGLAAWVLLNGEDALAADYRFGSFEADINNSLVGFNNDRLQLEFDLDLAASRDYLQELYGPDCRQ